MARATFLAFFAASAFFVAYSSRDDDEHAKDDVLMSVSPRNFQQLSAKQEVSGDANSALAQLRAQPGEKPEERAAVMPQSKPGEERSQSHVDSEVMSEAQMEAQAREDAMVWKAQAEATMNTVRKASSGLASVGGEARNLRKAVEELGEDFGLDASAKRHDEQMSAEARAKQHAEIRVALLESANEQQRLRQKADELDQRMQQTYSRLMEDEVHSQAGQDEKKQAEAPEKAKETEEEQFAKLEKETQSIRGWLSEIKQLRSERDAMKAKKDKAVKAATSLGLTPAQIQRELNSVSSAKAAEKAQEAADSVDASGKTSAESAEAHNKLDIKEIQSIQEQAAKMDAQSEQLANVMASSAIEMAQIQSAAGDVVDGLDAFTSWKKRQSDSPDSLAEAAKVKSQLGKSLKHLEHHEHLVEEHASQLKELMKNLNMLKE